MIKKLKEKTYILNEETMQIRPTSTIFMVDGYHFGDRLLESVMFKAKLSKDRKNIELIGTDSPKYMSDLNEKKWFKAALDYIVQTDYVFIENNLKSSDVILTQVQMKEFYPEVTLDE